MKKRYAEIDSVKCALATGIVVAAYIFFSTVLSLYGYSNFAEFLTITVWGKLGYSVSWAGAFIGAFLGFVYGFIALYVINRLYNKFISI